MTMTPFEAWAIDAYADNELDPADRAEVERLLAEDPEARTRLEGIRQQKTALRKVFGPVIEEPVPAALSAVARQGGRFRAHIAAPWAAMAAGLAMLAIGATGGWLAAQKPAPNPASQLVDAAIGAHQIYANEKRHAVEVSAPETDHLQSWLSKRIGVSFKVPDLNDQGYQFVGGRLLAAGNVPVGLLMYEDVDKRRLTVYLASNPQKNTAALEVETVGRLTACHWEEPDMVYTLVGEASGKEMRELALLVHDRFDS